MNRPFVVPALSITLALAGSACGGAPQDPSQLDSPRSELPSALTGAWFTGTLTSLEFYDTTNDRWVDRGGSGFYYIFDERGSYETGAVIDSTVGGCTVRLLGKEIGTVTVEGERMTAHRAWVRTQATNSCGQSGENEEGPETTEMSWSLEEDEFGEVLVIGLDGGTARYHRWND